MTKRQFIPRAIITAVLGLAFAVGMSALINPAHASTQARAPEVTADKCVPSPGTDEVSHTETVVDTEAWDEQVLVSESKTIHHDAVTHTVHHDAVTKIVHHEAVTHVVHHPATTKVIHHDAKKHSEYHFRKFTHTKESHDYGKTWTAFGAWTVWTPAAHESWQLTTTALGSPAFHAQDNQGRDQWYREWQAQYDGTSRVIIDKPAWDETVTDTEAWDETVTDTPAYDETVTVKDAWDEIVIDTPAYDEHIDAVYKTVHHEAVTHDVKVIDHEGTPPVVCEPPRKTPPPAKPVHHTVHYTG